MASPSLCSHLGIGAISYIIPLLRREWPRKAIVGAHVAPDGGLDVLHPLLGDAQSVQVLVGAGRSPVRRLGRTEAESMYAPDGRPTTGGVGSPVSLVEGYY